MPAAAETASTQAAPEPSSSVAAAAAPVVTDTPPSAATAAPVVTDTPPAAVAAPVAEPAPTVAATPAEPTGPSAAELAAVKAAEQAAREARLAAEAEQVSTALKAAIDELGTLKANAEERKDRAALAAFYAAHDYKPMFVAPEGLTAKALSAVDRFGKAAEDGLDPQDYPVPAVAPGRLPAASAKIELDLALDVIRYARHAQSGRFDPQRISHLVTAKPPVTDPNQVLAKVAGSDDVSAVLEAYNPPHEGYKRLKAKLAEMRAAAEPQTPLVRLPEGPVLKPGQKDARVAMLRERLGVTATVTANDASVYDASLVDAVKAFQKDHGISATGLVGATTVSALNDGGAGGATAKINDVIANMERWRWLPRDLGEIYVMVNVPDFTLRVMRDGQEIHKARVIVGRVENQTPIFSETMKHVIVNPYWNVPVSIVKKEMIGKAQQTAGTALTRGNFEVVVGSRSVDPTAVDWATVNPATVQIRQRPGDGNALGNIKFMFPNEHSVYIHDTSSRGLFAQSYRALSHGCVRVHEPFSFADAVLSEEPTKVDGAKLKKLVGGGEKTLMLQRHVPVHIAYWTAFVDDDGKLETRADLYGHNARVKKLLGLGG
ncbi:murein L,D-transpeptidase [Methyloraptor flagellatus]|uniref:L,D-transpeptidase family protein n=1 Tax=Methyloraptor flagellatus TaxID=3162530 RepID=A0AAU7X9P1_9HYPH